MAVNILPNGRPSNRQRHAVRPLFSVGTLTPTEVHAELHHDGWLEARGQLLFVSTFPELFKAIGRTWTTSEVKEDRFAIPEILDRSQLEVPSENPFSALGPGDLVTSGRAEKAWLRHAPISYWIFVGQDVSHLEATVTAQR